MPLLSQKDRSRTLGRLQNKWSSLRSDTFHKLREHSFTTSTSAALNVASDRRMHHAAHKESLADRYLPKTFRKRLETHLEQMMGPQQQTPPLEVSSPASSPSSTLTPRSPSVRQHQYNQQQQNKNNPIQNRNGQKIQQRSQLVIGETAAPSASPKGEGGGVSDHHPPHHHQPNSTNTNMSNAVTVNFYGIESDDSMRGFMESPKSSDHVLALKALFSQWANAFGGSAISLLPLSAVTADVPAVVQRGIEKSIEQRRLNGCGPLYLVPGSNNSEIGGPASDRWASLVFDWLELLDCVNPPIRSRKVVGGGAEDSKNTTSASASSASHNNTEEKSNKKGHQQHHKIILEDCPSYISIGDWIVLTCVDMGADWKMVAALRNAYEAFRTLVSKQYAEWEREEKERRRQRVRKNVERQQQQQQRQSHSDGTAEEGAESDFEKESDGGAEGATNANNNSNSQEHGNGDEFDSSEPPKVLAIDLLEFMESTLCQLINAQNRRAVRPPRSEDVYSEDEDGDDGSSSDASDEETDREDNTEKAAQKSANSGAGGDSGEKSAPTADVEKDLKHSLPTKQHGDPDSDDEVRKGGDRGADGAGAKKKKATQPPQPPVVGISPRPPSSPSAVASRPSTALSPRTPRGGGGGVGGHSAQRAHTPTTPRSSHLNLSSSQNHTHHQGNNSASSPSPFGAIVGTPRSRVPSSVTGVGVDHRNPAAFNEHERRRKEAEAADKKRRRRQRRYERQLAALVPKQRERTVAKILACGLCPIDPQEWEEVATRRRKQHEDRGGVVGNGTNVSGNSSSRGTSPPHPEGHRDGTVDTKEQGEMNFSAPEAKCGDGRNKSTTGGGGGDVIPSTTTPARKRVVIDDDAVNGDEAAEQQQEQRAKKKAKDFEPTPRTLPLSFSSCLLLLLPHRIKMYMVKSNVRVYPNAIDNHDHLHEGNGGDADDVSSSATAHHFSAEMDRKRQAAAFDPRGASRYYGAVTPGAREAVLYYREVMQREGGPDSKVPKSTTMASQRIQTFAPKTKMDITKRETRELRHARKIWS